MFKISAEKVKKPVKKEDPAKIKLGYEEDLHKIKIALVFLFAINCVHLFALLVYQPLYPMSAPSQQELLVVLYILIVFDILCLIPYVILYFKYKKL